MSTAVLNSRLTERCLYSKINLLNQIALVRQEGMFQPESDQKKKVQDEDDIAARRTRGKRVSYKAAWSGCMIFRVSIPSEGAGFCYSINPKHLKQLGL